MSRNLVPIEEFKAMNMKVINLKFFGHTPGMEEVITQDKYLDSVNIKIKNKP